MAPSADSLDPASRNGSRKTATMNEDIKPGDVVGLTEKALKDKEFRLLKPRQLHKIGHPNRFVVKEVFEDDQEGICLALFPCCGRYKKKSGEPYCGGHPHGLFEKLEAPQGISPEAPPEGQPEPQQQHQPGAVPRGQRRMVSIPGVGRAGLEYQEDRDGSRLKGEFFGLEGEVSGLTAEVIRALIKEAGIF